jgi:hypothetical protein
MTPPSPVGGPSIHVSVPAVPETGGGSGTEAAPFHSVAEALREAQNGAVVKLHAGHYLESVTVKNVSGLSARKILVEPAGDGPVFIDSLLPDFLHPNGRWDRVLEASGRFNGEYEWHQPFPLPAGITNPERFRVNSGAFLDRPNHTRLVGYSQPGDFRSNNQLWPKEKPGPANGNRIWREDTDADDGTYVPENRLGRIHRLPSLYMGPGVWFDQRVGHRKVHIRLTPTTNNIPGWPDYNGETDPNQLSLALCRVEDYALFLTNCHHITFHDLELRFGNPDTIRLNTCSNIAFDHCRIRSATHAIELLTGNTETDWNQDITLEHCVLDGGVPTWFFRSDRKDEYLTGPTNKDRVPQAETFRNRLGASTSNVQISGTARNRHVVVHHCEIINAHDTYIFGQDMEFHHNWINNLNDDAIALSGEALTGNAKIYCNVMTRCLTALSFAAGEELGPVYLYGNLIDLRLPTLGIRRTSASSPGTDSLRRGHFFKDGVNEGQIELFHNTCIVLDPGAKVDNPDGLTDAGYAYFIHPEESQPRRAFNNILVAVYTDPARLRPIAFLAPADFATQSDGNTYFRVPAGTENSTRFLVRTGSGNAATEVGYPSLLAYRRDQWPPNGAGGYEAKSVVGDPLFNKFDSDLPERRADFRLRPDSPARENLGDLPQKLSDMYGDATGFAPLVRGCYPHSGARLRVGVGSRRVFPFMPPPIGPPTHPDPGPLAPLDD